MGNEVKLNELMVKILLVLTQLMSVRKKMRFGDLFISMKKNGKVVKFKLSESSEYDLEETNSNWTPEQIKMKEEIVSGGYLNNHPEDYLKVTKDNVLIDGHHRVTALSKIVDYDYEIYVKKNIFIKWSKINEWCDKFKWK